MLTSRSFEHLERNWAVCCRVALQRVICAMVRLFYDYVDEHQYALSAKHGSFFTLLEKADPRRIQSYTMMVFLAVGTSRQDFYISSLTCSIDCRLCSSEAHSPSRSLQ